jgi:hypothetical protein
VSTCIESSGLLERVDCQIDPGDLGDHNAFISGGRAVQEEIVMSWVTCIFSSTTVRMSGITRYSAAVGQK